jgi:putative zinc finger/helix-turn-helix YgiT family protein
MNCVICGSRMKKESQNRYHYTASGLSRVYLNGVELYECTNEECGDEGLIIPMLEELHEQIATAIASQKNKLLPEEIRFLRTYLGFSGGDFAELIGVSPETVSRWEKGTVNMKESAERLLRVLILSRKGPFRDYEELKEFATQKRKLPKKREFKVHSSGWIEEAA